MIHITDLMYLKRVQADKEVYQVEETDQPSFYIVIRGKVQLFKKNEEGIPNWQWALNVYQSL